MKNRSELAGAARRASVAIEAFVAQWRKSDPHMAAHADAIKRLPRA